MKKFIILLSIAAIIIIIAVIMQEQKNNISNITLTEPQTIILPENTSGEIQTISKIAVSREAHKVGGFHTGVINAQTGYFIIKDQKIVGGKFIIDTTSITVSDISNTGMNESLVNHLKSDDFFATQTYPTAEIDLISLENNGTGYDIIANLTIKNITNQISFQATETTNNTREANLQLDRTNRDIMYSSTKLLDTIKDKAIDDIFSLYIQIEI